MKFHNNIRDKPCDMCPATFRAADALAKHKKVHEGYRPFRCLHCPISFKDRGTLKRHVTMDHKEGGPISSLIDTFLF